MAQPVATGGPDTPTPQSRVVFGGRRRHRTAAPNHHDAADVLHGIDPELGVVNTSPAHAARAAKPCGLRVAGCDLKTEAEFIVAGAERKRFGERSVGGRLQLHEDGTDVVLAHHLYRALAQDFRGPQIAVR